MGDTFQIAGFNMAIHTFRIHAFRVAQSLLLQTVRHLIIQADIGMAQFIWGGIGKPMVSTISFPAVPISLLCCNFRFRRWKYIRRDDCVSSQHITLSFQLLLSEALQSQSPMGIFIFAGGEFTVIVVGASNSNPLICDI